MLVLQRQEAGALLTFMKKSFRWEGEGGGGGEGLDIFCTRVYKLVIFCGIQGWRGGRSCLHVFGVSALVGRSRITPAVELACRRVVRGHAGERTWAIDGHFLHVATGIDANDHDGCLAGSEHLSVIARLLHAPRYTADFAEALECEVDDDGLVDSALLQNFGQIADLRGET